MDVEVLTILWVDPLELIISIVQSLVGSWKGLKSLNELIIYKGNRWYIVAQNTVMLERTLQLLASLPSTVASMCKFRMETSLIEPRHLPRFLYHMNIVWPEQFYKNFHISVLFFFASYETYQNKVLWDESLISIQSYLLVCFSCWLSLPILI